MYDLKGKKTLVTGGCGFIGINLVEELLKQGADVAVMDLPEADWSRLPSRVTQIKADILDKKQLVGTCRDMYVIYHLAARTDIDGKSIEEYSVNFTGTKNILEEVAKNKKIQRFVFYSTQLVVGIFNETRFINETEPYRTKTFYGQSKINGEKVVKTYCRKTNIPYTIIRPTSVYGPWGEAPYKAFFTVIKHGKYFHVGRANNLVSWVYVKNLVDLTILTSTHKAAENETFFGNDLYPYTMKEIVNAAGEYYGISIKTIPNIVITSVAYLLAVPKTLGINVPIYPFRLRNIKATYCYDVGKSLRLGYNPKFDLKDGIKETLDWYEARKLL